VRWVGRVWRLVLLVFGIGLVDGIVDW